MIPRRCQASQIVPAEVSVPSEEMDFSFHLSCDAATRLKAHALSPGEWLNLASIHGRHGVYLGDSLYDSFGRALRPLADVPISPVFPTAKEISENLGRQLDLAVAWERESNGVDPIQLLRAWSESELTSEISLRLVKGVAAAVEDELFLICSELLASESSVWLRDQWGASRRAIFGLAKTCLQVLGPSDTARCLSVWLELASQDQRRAAEHEVGLISRQLSGMHALQLGQLYVDGLDSSTKGGAACRLWAHLQDPCCLDWIERNVPASNVGSEWGQLAAASRITWEQCAKWIRSGRPLSLVALDALYTCGCFEPQRVVPEVLRRKPHLLCPASEAEMTACLRDYVQRDSAPRVRNQVATIIAGWASVDPGLG